MANDYSWIKRSDSRWDFWVNGEPAGYVVKVKFKNGTVQWQGIAFDKKTKKMSSPVSAKERLTAKNAVARKAKTLRGIR